MAVHGRGHGSGAPVRVLEIEKGRPPVHGLEDFRGAAAGCQHSGRLAGVLLLRVRAKDERRNVSVNGA